LFLLQGASRGGKGVMVRTACKLVGKENTCAISIRNLAKDFALFGAKDAMIITIPDISTPKRGLPPEIVEICKTISGGDGVDINGKGRDIVTRPLSGKIIASTNDLLEFNDPSGALFERLVGLKFTRRFLPKDHPEFIEGQEQDPELERKLDAELPGILNWALDGLARLRNKKRFSQPAASLALKTELSEEGSPVKKFIADCLIVGNGKVATNTVYERWVTWCSANQYTPDNHPAGSPRAFGKLLSSALPQLQRKHGAGKQRETYYYYGIELRNATPSEVDG
jgi:putative DNA primase/helicase